jgi:Domain of unknown function (DUF4262)
MEKACGDDDKLIDDIEKFGFTVILIEATNYLPSFGYTVGLFAKYNHSELIAFGLSTKTIHAILNIGGEMVKKGQVLKTKTRYSDFFENGGAQFLTVDPGNTKDYFGYAIWFNKSTEFPSLQLVWTDRQGRYPWEGNFEKDLLLKQPLLDRNADFKYRESRNLAVFTTRQHLAMNKPILRVVHDEDGEWQFLTGDQMPDDIKIVCLHDMIDGDKSLNDLFNLDYGEYADRDHPGAPWIRGTTEQL